MPFTALGLLPELARALSDRGYTAPTPVQAQVIPVVLEGRDVLAGAQTGTGKTAGFALPILQRLHTAAPKTSKAPRILVLVPTRELAAQVEESFRLYGKYLRIRTLVLIGGVSINPQIDKLRNGAEVIVATPGRLLDHAMQRTIDLRQIEVLVLDEADRMLDMGFIHDIKRVIKLLPAQRQNLLFSATYSDDIRRLAQGLLHSPVEIEVARRNVAADRVTQHAHLVHKEGKRALLSHLIRTGEWSQVLVFTRTKHGANRLAKQLAEDGIATAAIHGNKSQSARTQALADFKQNRVQALIATEIAARGLDIKELPYVVNYELPNVPEDYVHRIGRTGRAGAEGIAISLVSQDEVTLLKAIERVLGRQVPRVAPPAQLTPPPYVAIPVAQETRAAAPQNRPARHRGNSQSNSRPSAPRQGSPGGGNRSQGQSASRPAPRSPGQGQGNSARRSWR
jgi:ATP-dependent RNA helicase RhlE